MVAPPDNDVLWARGLTYAHDGSPALQGVSMGVREGEILAVTGPRGSGKTTLLRCLSGQLRPQKGEVWFNSIPVHTMGTVSRERLRRDRFGWIDPEPALVPELNVWENTALPLMLRGTGRRAAKAAALEWLERLDIRDTARKRPHALLQSERQRVVVARALVAAPTVLFADEPTAPLHRAERSHVLRTLTAAARSHAITVVLATHDAETAALADRTVTLLDGRCVRTVHLPSTTGEARPTTRGTSRTTTRDDGRTPARGQARPAARRSGRTAAREEGGTPAPEDGRTPATRGDGRTTTRDDGRTPARDDGRTPARGQARAAARGEARGAGEGERLAATVGKARHAAGDGSRSAFEGDRPTATPSGRPAEVRADRPPATATAPEGDGRTSAAEDDDSGKGDRPSAAEGGGRAACSLSV
ncbi:ABC transporter ATP-binding protein YtrE [Streptomyces sp. MA5143a]|nr:ABC transporter ATP-binding protein YtrE [Streptomyces sp. MA5143a]